jgi:iron complex outermembrane receptor protein
MKLKPIAFAAQILVTAASISAPFTSMAQEQEVQQESTATVTPLPRSNELTTILITGTKRSENVQKVATSVAVLSGDDLRAQGINSAGGLQDAIPSLSFNDNGSGRGSALSIRGIGTLSFSDAVEPSVGLVVDGVVLGRTSQGLGTLFDVERIEVLRGPQGTLFGKNSSAGVVNIVTRDPNLKKAEGEVNLGIGSYQNRKIDGGASFVLQEDTAAVRIAFLKNRRDGYIKNILDGREFGAEDQKGVRIKALLKPNNDRRILLNFDYMNENDSNGPRIAVLPQLAVADPRNLDGTYLSAIMGPENVQTNTSGDVKNLGRFKGISLQWDEKLGEHSLTAIGAVRKADLFNRIVGSVPNDPFFDNYTTNDLKQSSLELRVASPKGPAFDYVAGAYFSKQSLDAFSYYEADVWGINRLIPIRNLVLGQLDLTSTTDNNSAAIFAQGNYRVNEQLSFLAGARYTRERIEMQAVSRLGTYQAITGATMAYQPLLVPPGTVSGDAVTKRPSWQIGARYEPGKSSMYYATLSQGFKGKGFNTSAGTGTAELVQPEIATSLELGYKSRFLNNRAKANLAIFRTDFKDFQTQAVKYSTGSVATAALINAEKLRSQGAEFELEARLAETWKAGINGAFIDAKYVRFTAGPCYPTLIATGGCQLGYRDLSGGVLAGTPRRSANLSLTKDIDLPTLPFDASIQSYYSWKDKIQWDPAQDPETVARAYGTLGLNIGLTDKLERWSVVLAGRNLTNEFHAPLRNWNYAGGRVQHIVPADYQRVWSLTLTGRY